MAHFAFLAVSFDGVLQGCAITIIVPLGESTQSRTLNNQINCGQVDKNGCSEYFVLMFANDKCCPAKWGHLRFQKSYGGV